MKKCAFFCLILLLLTGCVRSSDPMEAGIELRSKLLQATECSFDADITADYGDKLHTFSMECMTDANGTVTFTVREPDTIAGITGKLSADGGALIFDDTALHFELLAEEQLSPVSTPWVLMRTLRSGNITAACAEESRIRLSADDSYEEDPLRLDIWLNEKRLPEKADILYDGRRILSVAVENFTIV